VVRLLTEVEIDVAAGTLGCAFVGDPLMVHAIPDAGLRQRLMATHLAPGVRLARWLGEVWCTDDMTAVACWRRPDSGPPSASQLSQAGVDRLPAPIGARAASRADPVYEFLASRRDALAVPHEHWYLSMIGVDPPQQRRGLGSAVLQPVFDTAHQRHEPVFLETMNEQNVGFYRRNGFQEIEHGVEPASALRYWLFLGTP
jgi:GNAT superfamily N-acetyltransferase